MALILPVNDVWPVLGNNCYVADNATIVGDVVCGDDCSFWFQSVVRGDVHQIRIGHRVNVQDGAVLHCTFLRAPLTIGNEVSIGHRAIVHGCTIGDQVLVGMGAIVMDHAVVEPRVLIAAGAVVLENAYLKSGWVYAGVPAKPVKSLDDDLLTGQIKRIADNYVMYSSWFKR